jgi:hypothetical protein
LLLGISGFGRLAQNYYTPALRRLSGARVIAVADPLPASRAAAEKLLPGLRAYESNKMMLDCEALAGLLVASPPSAHLAAWNAAAAYPALAVFMEKPFVLEGQLGEADASPDAARIAIEVQIKPPKPVEGQPFEMSARLVNGGDMSITLTKIEESAVRSRAGFVEAAGVAVPATVEVGGALVIFRYSGVLTETNVFLKDLRVTDSVGDSWKTTIRLSVCPD